ALPRPRPGAWNPRSASEPDDGPPLRTLRRGTDRRGVRLGERDALPGSPDDVRQAPRARFLGSPRGRGPLPRPPLHIRERPAPRPVPPGPPPPPADHSRRFEELTGHRILERYGMSETLFTLSNLYEDRRPGTVGLPVPGCEVRIVDDSGAEAKPGEPGEILV